MSSISPYHYGSITRTLARLKNETLLSRLASWEIPLVEDNQEELFLDSLDKILAQCVEKQIENLQAKERSVGLSTEEKRELQDLILKGLKA